LAEKPEPDDGAALDERMRRMVDERARREVSQFKALYLGQKIEELTDRKRALTAEAASVERQIEAHRRELRSILSPPKRVG
jgi:FtsZ-binding cell division protein ZapB